ncbi:hypothetical protein [Streptomyces sp. NPDC058086]|uniref:hypothetical protein n=1 Tax=Streptomyces sp. NPDC058086 TaxID=3346334 RepID=UPI0036EAC5E6
MTTIDTAAITVVLPEAFDKRWSRLPGIQVDGRRITIDPAEYFFRFESHTWLVADWELVNSQLLNTDETTENPVEQLALDFIKAHAAPTSDAARVLATAYDVYAYLFRDEHLASLGLSQITAEHLRMLREAATLMALNKVELDGHISNVGPCWFFPAATSVGAAIRAADDGAVVSIQPGSYKESLVLDRDITVVAEKGRGTVRITAAHGPGVSVSAGQASSRLPTRTSSCRPTCAPPICG